MLYSQLGNSHLSISKIVLGTWSFGGDKIWWGGQSNLNSFNVMQTAIEKGVNIFDTAPIYGKGRSENIIGEFLTKTGLRDKIYIATKCGLRWNGKEVYHDLSQQSILEEFDSSRKRLQTDIIDLYQIHFPDKNTPIEKTAETLYSLYSSGKIKAVGVSNFSVPQIKTFQKYCPVHSLQPPYNLFARHIEKKEIPFCLENNIGIISYVPLQQGILTGKYHFKTLRPKGLKRRTNPDLNGKRFDITRKTLLELEKTAKKYNLSLAQLAINWVIQQEGITGAIVGIRDALQTEENLKILDTRFDHSDIEIINNILEKRKQLIHEL